MSILLIVEVMDWAPMTLTHREHKLLMIIAEDCRDSTRETWRVLDSPDVLRRARLSRAQMYATIKSLIAKGCLERVTAGGFGHRAKYRIPPLVGLRSVPEMQTQDEAPSVPETETQDEAAVSQNPGPFCVTENDELCPGNRDTLCLQNRDAYPSEPLSPPSNPPLNGDRRYPRTGSRPAYDTDEDLRQREEDQDQKPGQDRCGWCGGSAPCGNCEGSAANGETGPWWWMEYARLGIQDKPLARRALQHAAGQGEPWAVALLAEEDQQLNAYLSTGTTGVPW